MPAANDDNVGGSLCEVKVLVHSRVRICIILIAQQYSYLEEQAARSKRTINCVVIIIIKYIILLLLLSTATFFFLIGSIKYPSFVVVVESAIFGYFLPSFLFVLNVRVLRAKNQTSWKSDACDYNYLTVDEYYSSHSQTIYYLCIAFNLDMYRVRRKFKWRFQTLRINA